MSEIVINGEKAVLGRVASYAAKLALKGESIAIINCEKIIITGNPQVTIAGYKKIRDIGGSIIKGPFFPKTPEKIVKRTVRGMLPYRQQRGRDALKRVICYNGMPDQYKETPMIKTGRSRAAKNIEMGEISKEL